MQNNPPHRIAIMGGSGYTGCELLRVCATHPELKVTGVASRAEADRPLSEVFPSLGGAYDLSFVTPDALLQQDYDLLFYATPHAVAMHTAAAVLERGARVVDLSADFRISDAEVWRTWYGVEHVALGLLAQAVYGLPELNREAIVDASLVANPGCYPTASTLALLPLVEAGALAPSRVIIDAKSGVTGAGRGLNVGNLFAQCADSFRAYKVDGHRHQPEIESVLGSVATLPPIKFVPHLVPMLRGIHATVYAELDSPDLDVQALFEARYQSEPFVEVLPPGQYPATADVRGSNLCRIAVHQEGSLVVVLSVIDNLAKGASTQAVQNCNIMFGLPEDMGLAALPVAP